jgi:hypothetical protein
MERVLACTHNKRSEQHPGVSRRMRAQLQALSNAAANGCVLGHGSDPAADRPCGCEYGTRSGRWHDLGSRTLSKAFRRLALYCVSLVLRLRSVFRFVASFPGKWVRGRGRWAHARAAHCGEWLARSHSCSSSELQGDAPERCRLIVHACSRHRCRSVRRAKRTSTLVGW